MIVDRFWELLAKKTLSEVTEDELREFEDFLATHPNLRNPAKTLDILVHQSVPPEKISELDQAFEKHIERMRNANVEFDETGTGPIGVTETARNKTSNRRTRRWGLLVGSVGMALVTLILLKYGTSPARQQAQKVQLSQVTTKPGSKTQIELPDGSTVWLNSSSHLTYEKDFGKNLREVDLTGEAFFDVVKDPAHPFVIHTKVMDVKVLGTEFNVRAYPNDEYTETSLIRGSVEVTVKNRPDEKHYLKPNEKVSVANDILDETVTVRKMTKPEPFIVTQPLTYYRPDSTVIETSWVQNKLIFQENETFREVALRMERWYGVQISFADEEVAQIRPFGSFTNETIRQALDALKESFKFGYQMTGTNIIITK